MGKHGPLEPNPNGNKQRVQGVVYGTVIKATEKGEWDVRFDFDGRRKVVCNNTLKVVHNDTGVLIQDLQSVASTTASVPTENATNSNGSNSTGSYNMDDVSKLLCCF